MSDIEWLKDELYDRCPALYSLGYEILYRIRKEFPSDGQWLRKTTNQNRNPEWAHEFIDTPVNFWTIQVQPKGHRESLRIRHAEPCLEVCFYGRPDGPQGEIEDWFTKEGRLKLARQTYSSVKIDSPKEIDALMARIRLGYKLKCDGK